MTKKAVFQLNSVRTFVQIRAKRVYLLAEQREKVLEYFE